MAENKGNNNISSVFESLLKSANVMFSTKTVVGEPIHVEDCVLVPLVDISFGMGAGATAKDDGNEAPKNGGAGGMNGKMSPCAVLMIKNGQTRVIHVKNQDNVGKVIDMIPDLVDRFTSKKEKMMDDEDAVDAAFPDEKKQREGKESQAQKGEGAE